jgi:Uma2 family endonuclease
VAFVSAQRWPLDRELPPTGDWPVIPDLAVEVVSPNDIFQDVVAKMKEYFRLGVRQVWIILPLDRQVYVYDSPTQVRIVTTTEDLDGGAILPGFRVPLATLFHRGAEAGQGTPA